jgi:hypothetical protein
VVNAYTRAAQFEGLSTPGVLGNKIKSRSRTLRLSSGWPPFGPENNPFPLQYNKISLSRPGWPDYIFAFHDQDEIGPRMLSRIAKRTGLKSEDL